MFYYKLSVKFIFFCVTRSLEHKVLHGAELVRVMHVGLLDELRLGLIPEDVLFQLWVDLILVHNGHTDLEVAVQELVQLEILDKYNISGRFHIKSQYNCTETEIDYSKYLNPNLIILSKRIVKSLGNPQPAKYKQESVECIKLVKMTLKKIVNSLI